MASAQASEIKEMMIKEMIKEMIKGCNPGYLTRTDPALMKLSGFEDPDFKVLEVYNVNNDENSEKYELFKSFLTAQIIDPNEHQNMYHVSKADIASLINKGLDPQYSRGGNFGTGIYFTDSPIKANDYSVFSGKLDAVRMMLQCRVILGSVKTFEEGKTNPMLVGTPIGYHSIMGSVRRGNEYVVYKSDQILIERIIFYKYTNLYKESAASRCKSNARNIVKMPSQMSTYLHFITTLSPNKSAIKFTISSFLSKKTDVDQFITDVSSLITIPQPPNIRELLISWVQLCQFNISPTVFPGHTPATTDPMDTMDPMDPMDPTDTTATTTTTATTATNTPTTARIPK
jgi:hypothetical protein